MEFLYLCEEDMVKAGVKDMPKCIDAMEETFRLLKQGDYRLGGADNSDHGLRVMFPEESDIPNMPLAAPGRWFTAMPAYLGGKYHVFGVKSYGANQNNTLRALPRSVLMVSLMDVETGAPLAYMSANILSAMRTGAVSGLFAKYFASKMSKKIAVIGPGVMARYSLDAVMLSCSGIKEISIFGRGGKSKEAFKNHCVSQKYGFEKYAECVTVEEACQDADIIITANTQAQKFDDYPLIPGNCLKDGACIIVVSAVRIERACMSRENVRFVADDVRMYVKNRGIDAQPETEEAKKTVTVKEAIHEALEAEKKVLNLPEIVERPDYKRNNKDVYICASGGIPIEDVSWAYECYRNALDNRIGVWLKVWDNSAL